jgi:hypothetical protein
MGALSAASLALPACVERKITIGSDPSGALVTMNDVDVGRTPITVPFTWYGDYDIILRYEKNIGTPDQPVMQHYYLRTHRRATAGPSQWVGVDLITELLPMNFVDQKVWAFVVPQVPEQTDADLIKRAQELKGHLGEPEALQKKK